MNYFAKMRDGATSPPRISLSEIVWSWLGAFLGVTAVSFINYKMLDGTDLVMLITSFGATAVLLFGGIRSPLAQPRNVIGGHIISAIIGVSAYQVLHGNIWLAAPVAVAMAVACMQATRTLHPPGGATALIALIGGTKIHALGYLYVVMPVGVGIMILLAVALLVNNIPRNRSYPQFWY